jgi:hypothetical protein
MNALRQELRSSSELCTRGLTTCSKCGLVIRFLSTFLLVTWRTVRLLCQMVSRALGVLSRFVVPQASAACSKCGGSVISPFIGTITHRLRLRNSRMTRDRLPFRSVREGFMYQSSAHLALDIL